jgi:hypothetical protein
MSLGVVDELEEDIGNRSTDECTQIEEFAVDAMQSGLEEVAFSRVFAIEKIEELSKRRLAIIRCVIAVLDTYLKHKASIDMALRNVRVEVRRLNEAKEEFVDYL